MQLEDRLGLITGAGSGIGRALATRAAREGMRLVLTGRNETALQETMTQLGPRANAHIVVADIAEPAGRARLCAFVQQTFGRLDLLIHNAGVQWAGSIESIDDAALDAMLRTNLLAPMALTRDLMPALRAGVPSRVVFVGSMFGDIGFPLFGAYSASKFGVRGYADALRREVGRSGIGVTYVAPRGTRTAMAASVSEIVGAFGMKLDPPEALANHIIRAIRRDARSVYPWGAERLFVLIQRLAPALVDHGLARQLAVALRGRRTLPTAQPPVSRKSP